MGGNGARSRYLAGTLDSYDGARFDTVGFIDDVKVITVRDQNRTKIPMEAFSSEMFYVTNPQTGLIEHITFHDKNGNIKHSIDLDFDNDGSLKPYREFFRKGRMRSEGTHFHKEWKIADNGDKGRVSHQEGNIGQVNRYYMRFVNKAIEFNKQKLNK